MSLEAPATVMTWPGLTRKWSGVVEKKEKGENACFARLRAKYAKEIERKGVFG